MNKFNLTFSGKIQAGQNPAQVKLRFAQLFAIDDPVRLERFFSGQTIILRRNLERKAAAQHYHELHLLGVVAALVKVTASEAADAIVNAPQPAPRNVSDTSRRDKAVIAAWIKARNEESRRLAVEKAATEKGIQDEQQRRAEEEAARREDERAHIKRREAETKRKATADAARQKALREQQKAERARKKAEDAAQRKAALEQIKQQEAAAAARHKAELEEIKRREAEEAARVQAELAAMQRREAEEAARLKAELDEIERQEAEEAVRLQAELEDIKRQEAQQAARIKAAAQRKEAEAQRKSAERRRAAAEQLAVQRALRKEDKRKAIAQQTEQKAQRAQAVQQQAAETARHKAELLRREALEQQEHAVLSAALQEQVVARGAAELAQSTTLKVTRARVKTSLEVPQRKAPQTAAVTAPAPRKRQPGEPNLYTLRPFRNTDDVRARAVQADRRMRQGYTLGAIALAALLVAGGIFLGHAPAMVITGATAMVIDPQSAPLVLAGDALLLHDRAGVSTGEVALNTLGVSALAAPLAFDSSGALLALGQLDSDNDTTNTAGGHFPQLLRCELVPARCAHFSPELAGSSIAAFVIHPLDGSLLLADRAAGELLKINREGHIVARAPVAVPEQPVLRLHGGLLLMNSAAGPGIGVFRYEDTTFGQQLDEILLLPPSVQQAEQSRVDDFLWSSGTWWASLHTAASGSGGLYRFDETWNYIDEVAQPGPVGPLQLINWGEKTLVNNPQQLAVQRFNAQGASEVPFVSSQLAKRVAGEQRRVNLTTMAWRAGLLLCTLATLLGFGFGYLQSLRRLVYKPHRERGAEPVDDHVDALHWIDPVPHRLALLRRRGSSYGLLVLGILLLAVAQSVTVWQLAALLLALCGPAIALLVLSRHPIGHIGVLQDRLLLVDHRGVYHLAGGSGVQYHGPFLLIDDVVVYSGSRLLPAFTSLQLQQRVRPLALGGVKVDRNTMVVKLLQCRHPFAQGAGAILATAIAAVIVLCLHSVF